MGENRKEKRFLEEDEVSIKYISSTKKARKFDNALPAKTYDISLGGARLVCPVPFDIGCVLRMEINLKRSNKLLKIDAEVKWCQPKDNDLYEVGVEFLHNISQTLLLLLKHLYTEKDGIPSSVS